jgi:hypothetical protein
VAPMCEDCPFRPRTFVPLSGKDAARLADFVADGNLAICHHTEDAPCGGAERFRAGDLSTFASRAKMIQAHARSRREPKRGLWGI